MNTLKTIVLSSFCVGWALVGCGGRESASSAPPSATPEIELVAGTQTMCPIMGSPINKDIYEDYQGNRVYFCCSGCEAAFKKDPEKIIKQMEDEGIVLTKIIQKQ